MHSCALLFICYGTPAVLLRSLQTALSTGQTRRCQPMHGTLPFAPLHLLQKPSMSLLFGCRLLRQAADDQLLDIITSLRASPLTPPRPLNSSRRSTTWRSGYEHSLATHDRPSPPPPSSSQ
eukprot:Sspe_Gene.118829::Locus_113229_Transcript_1_1_Confidence_1.000_Length_518::g.118829::m.118829